MVQVIVTLFAVTLFALSLLIQTGLAQFDGVVVGVGLEVGVGVGVGVGVNEGVEVGVGVSCGVGVGDPYGGLYVLLQLIGTQDMLTPK